jgi:hypothetical protein
MAKAQDFSFKNVLHLCTLISNITLRDITLRYISPLHTAISHSTWSLILTLREAIVAIARATPLTFNLGYVYPGDIKLKKYIISWETLNNQGQI